MVHKKLWVCAAYDYHQNFEQEIQVYKRRSDAKEFENNWQEENDQADEGYDAAVYCNSKTLNLPQGQKHVWAVLVPMEHNEVVVDIFATEAEAVQAAEEARVMSLEDISDNPISDFVFNTKINWQCTQNY